MTEFKLFNEIVSLSTAKDWDEAKNEWKLHHIYESETPETCLCGKYPIIELCVIVNIKNGKTATVGNQCVKNFLNLPSNKIFDAIKRVRKDDSKSLNIEALDYCYEKAWITDWEYNFYKDIMRKRNLTHKQLSKKKQINNLLASKMKKP